MEDESIGQRIARLRKTRGTTQQALAQHAAISVSLLRKVEQGSRDATPVVVAAVARALAVDVTTLTGQPYHREGRRPDRIHAHMPALRRALAHWDAAPDLPTAPRSAVELAAASDGLAVLRQSDRYTQLAELLPVLLMETTAAFHEAAEGPSRQRDTLSDALAGLLHAAHSLTYKTGYEDLSTIVEGRLVWISHQSGDPLMSAMTAYSRTSSLLRTGAYDAGLRLLDAARRDIEPGTRTDDGALRMTGSLHLRAAVLAARAGDAGLASTHIDEARDIAGHLGADTPGGWRDLAFGPGNAAIHDVAVSIELGDSAQALDKAEGMHLPGNISRTRAAHHHMDLARAYLWHGRRDHALDSLRAARALAPQQTRHHPTTHEVVRMLVRAHRHSNEPLARFATWIGDEG